MWFKQYFKKVFKKYSIANLKTASKFLIDKEYWGDAEILIKKLREETKKEINMDDRFDVVISISVKGAGVEGYESVSTYSQTTREKVVALEALLGDGQAKFLGLYGDSPEVVKKVLGKIEEINSNGRKDNRKDK